MLFARATLTIAASLLLVTRRSAAQTYTSCNPLHGTCPADPALGKSINVDFTKGAVDSFRASGNPTYSSNGASFTVAHSGDSPTLSSLFYIMFGKVSITMKAAPGAGIVSTLVLESDDLDEIDLEWLGGDSGQVQSNYFGQGDTTTYNRGAFHATPNNQNQFVTYTIEWTADQIVWSVGGTVVRAVTPAQAAAGNNKYPQTPMQVKFGTWSGGDPSNAPGTIQWAGGPTDYSRGPFSMIVQSIAISDYSTGTKYSYGSQSGKWQDIVAANGKVNGNKDNSGTPVVVTGPTVTSASPSIPAGVGDSSKTGYPWVASPTTLQTVAATSSVAGIPSGWTVSSSGKIIPASSAAPSPTPSSSPSPSPPLSSSPFSATFVTAIASPSPPLPAASDILTTWDDRGFLTTMTVPAGYTTMHKCFDNRGFVTACAAAATAPAATITTAVNQQLTTGKNVANAAATTNAANVMMIPGISGMRMNAGIGCLLAFWLGVL